MRELLLCAGLLLVASSAQAYTGFGVCNYGKETIPSVVCYGPTVLKQTTVTGDIKVTGALQAENISARALLIEGSVDLRDSQISGSVNITGSLNADHVEFQKGVAVESDSVILSHTKVNGLMTVTSTQKNPYLQVQCSSVITGSVLFDGKAGVVQVTGDSLVQGKVVNGSLEFVKRECD
ncbi:hypothetical protein AQUSIP_21130 [Aquicella siphonis]|uniref:Polymer-forming cytoskeletal n=1 Tax=Aquicella siphonis TaxID=254247 RepID=A0A5E4PKP9_9COXI|nr:hypothetical protein [Aquicella siphonis]VVC76786.1 hypothetical protein AQUSIP_21130 [Aquicella siphonis]